MSKYAVGYSPFGKIQVGRLNSKGNMFLDDREYHTDEAVYAVIQHVIEDFDGAMELKVGDRTYTLEAKELKSE